MYREASIFYFITPFSWCSLFFKNTFKISVNDTFLHISLTSLGFYLSRECLLMFSNLCIYSTMWGNIFQFMVFTFLEKAVNLCIFIHAPVPHSKLQVECFENLLPQDKRMEETMICLIKIQSENIKITWNISFFIFCMICNFSKCNGCTVLWIISIK